MTCEHALELMLEADPAELSGGGDSPLAAHIAGCGRCAAVAAALAGELAELDDELAAFAAAGDADAAADRALAAIRSAARSGGPDVGRVRAVGADEEAGRGVGREGSSHRWRRLAWVPVAAAAVVAALLLGPLPDFPAFDRGAGDTSGVTETETTETRFAVETPAGRNAAVMKTANPKITVVWIY